MSRDEEKLIRELVTSDGPAIASEAVIENFDPVSYVIKTIFQTGRQESFTEHLTHFIHKKEAEIEKMCNFHYQEFVQSVDQLLKVRLGTVNLRSKIVDLNSEMQEAGTKIVEKKKEIIDYRRILLNVEITMESLKTCLHVLDIANKITNQIEIRKYYSALRMLESLQNVHLKQVAQFEFSKKIAAFIPHQRDNIRFAISKEMKEWFASVHQHTRNLGKIALLTTSKRQEVQQLKVANGGKASIESLTASISIDVLVKEENDAFDYENRIDFKSLYQAIHINDVLGRRKEFKLEFEENRKMQGHNTFDASFSLHDGDIRGFEAFLHDIVGFFIIEAVILHSTQDFRSRTAVDGLWELATDKINFSITESLQDCENPDLFLKIKLSVVAFIQTLESYGYPVSNLTTLMLSLFDRYAELMKFRCCETVSETIEEDDYAPMIVNSMEEYDAVLKLFRIKEEKKVNMKFPRALPFSRGFPYCCDHIKNFIIGFYHFAEGFNQQQNEMDDLLKKSLENLLVHTLGTQLLRKIGTGTLPQVAQIFINVEYFELACGEFEDLLMEKRAATHKGKLRLQSTKSFRELRLTAERRLFELIHIKINEYVGSSDYEWLPTATRTKPATYLKELLHYITTTMTSTLSGLPAATKNYLLFDAFTYLSTCLLELLTNKSGKKINAILIDNFDLDIGYIESFVSSLPDIDCSDTFVEIKQTIEFLKSDNYEDYLNSSVKSKKYSRVRINNLLILLEKLKVEASFLTKLTPAEKLKRKSIELVLKELKELKDKEALKK